MSSSFKRSILITGDARLCNCSVNQSLSQLEAKGIEVLPLDVTSAESIATLQAEISKRSGGKLDMLLNNAGMMYEAPAIEADRENVRRMFNANVFGLFDMVTAFVPLLLASVPDSQAPPTIINTSSILSRLPFPFAAGYNASKAAVASYSDTIRVELAPLGIKVVTLFMGEVSTGLMSADNISFGHDSLYSDVEGSVQERSKHHGQTSMRAEEFARQVVHEVISKPAAGKGEFLWKGTNASLVWFLNAVGWRTVFDGTMMSGVGLDKKEIKKSIFDKGQHWEKRD
ncbi:unnamed protein product [Penicillium egyptiacum]|uniref:Uncharacterized protein n=1 Tax=Penicillium egyptiacum TaxID=1303716 RepID=A0A9W4KEX5_9EURO|nr:unnamed protein product [Penicillium egyptiacum]